MEGWRLFDALVRRSGLKCALRQAAFLYGDHHHWRSSSQGRSARFCHPVLREDWAAGQTSANRRAAPLRNRRLELFGGRRRGQARWVPNGRDQAPLPRIWQRDPGVPPMAITRATQDNRNGQSDRESEENETSAQKGGRCKCPDPEECGKGLPGCKRLNFEG